MTTNGILIVTAIPPASMEEEFNAWYDLEHLPERVGVPGFETGLRYCMSGAERRYLALYDLTGIDVLNTEEYLSISGERSSPWTKRVVGRSRFQRFTAVQVFPGHAVTRQTSRLLFLHFRGAECREAEAVVEGAKRNFGDNEEIRFRVFASGSAEQAEAFVIVDGHGQLESAFDPKAYGAVLPSLRTVGLYTPY